VYLQGVKESLGVYLLLVTNKEILGVYLLLATIIKSEVCYEVRIPLDTKRISTGCSKLMSLL
jgi:hypothetical protein